MESETDEQSGNESSPENESSRTIAEFHGSDFNEITDAVWDGDNTMWDWMIYAVPAYEGMARTIAKESGKTEDEVMAAMKKFYTLVGTIEHAGLIQGLEAQGFFTGVPNYNRDELILKVQKNFSKKRSNFSHVYPGIQKAFKTLHEKGIKNHVLTDAPAFQLLKRLRKSRLDPYVHSKNAMPAAKIENLPELFKERERNGAYDGLAQVNEMQEEKPYTNLEAILHLTREQIRRQVVILGDNDSKDMELARRYGCRAIHAVYGEAPKELLERLLRFAPERVARRNTNVNAAPAHQEANDKPNAQPRIVTAKNSREILPLLGIKPARKW